MKLYRRPILVLVAVAALAAAVPPRTLAVSPIIERGSGVDYFFDDFVLEVCGIETFTTLTERWTLKIYPDGSEHLHVVRTFVPDDPRIPVEKGAATSYFAPDGTQRVIGKPLHLIKRNGGGTILLDAGWVELGEDVTVRGPHPSLGVDLADYYCP